MNKLLWYPSATIPDEKHRMVTRGKYEKGFPEGAVLHFSAGASAQSAYDWGRLNGFCFFVIGKDGRVIQGFPLSHYGYHCFPSSHPSLGNSLNRKLVGIEMDCAGILELKGDKFFTWYNKEVPKDQVRFSEKDDNIKKGHYQKFTVEQEISLKALLFWLKKQAPDVFQFDNVVSHDEISPDRKTDVGASLSMNIESYRKFLKESFD